MHGVGKKCVDAEYERDTEHEWESAKYTETNLASTEKSVFSLKRIQN